MVLHRKSTFRLFASGTARIHEIGEGAGGNELMRPCGGMRADGKMCEGWMVVISDQVVGGKRRVRWVCSVCKRVVEEWGEVGVWTKPF